MPRLDPVSLDAYDVREPIGSGAMARVFAAVERETGRPVALKLLDAANRGSRELRERMAREAVFLASLESPYVSRLLGYGWEGEQPFLVLEKLTGETLAALLKREKHVAAPRLVEWVEQLLIGLRDCHEANVIHRDIKPGNIFLEQAGGGGGGEPVVKLIDFGVARLSAIASAGASLTSTHHLIGSVGYMAPEQLEYAKGVGPAADLYAVGAVVFRSLTGRLPFVGRSFEALIKMKAEATAPPVSSLTGAASPALDAWVARALERDPDQRFPSAAEMLRAWWQVAAALDRDAEPAFDVVFDEDEWQSTVAGSVSRTGGRVDPASSTSVAAVVQALEKDLVEGEPVRVAERDDSDLDLSATDPQMTRPGEGG